MHVIMCVCTYVRKYICMYVCMQVYIYTRLYVCMCVCVYMCVYVCMYVSMYVCIYVYITNMHISIWSSVYLFVNIAMADSFLNKNLEQTLASRRRFNTLLHAKPANLSKTPQNDPS